MEMLTALITCSVNKSWFSLMYVVGLCTSVVIMYLQCYSIGVVCLVQVLFFMHLCRRLWECLYITDFGNSKMHISGLLVGIVHYVFTPISIYLAASTPSVSKPAFKSSDGTSLLLVCLLFVFEFACYAQNRCHMILFCIKRSLKSTPGARYAVPKGFWFDLVACPHYLSEILIYLSLLLLLLVLYAPVTDFIPWLQRFNFGYCMLWVTTNLAVVAHHQLHWYHSEPSLSSQVPPNWCALIPGIW